MIYNYNTYNRIKNKIVGRMHDVSLAIPLRISSGLVLVTVITEGYSVYALPYIIIKNILEQLFVEFILCVLNISVTNCFPIVTIFSSD